MCPGEQNWCQIRNCVLLVSQGSGPAHRLADRRTLFQDIEMLLTENVQTQSGKGVRSFSLFESEPPKPAQMS